MKNRSPFSAFRIFSLALIILALVLTVLQLVSFSRVRAFFPSGLRIAGVPVGGLDRSQAAARLLEVYSTPVGLRYNGAEIHLQPTVIDFQLDVEAMLAAADLERTQKLFWEEFWDYLWGRSQPPAEIPLRSSYSEARLRNYLQEVAERYDEPSVAAQPIPGTVNFEPGKSGLTLDEDGAVVLVENALHNLVNRIIELPLERTSPTRPSLLNLEILLKQTLQVNEFEGIAGIYFQDMQTAQELHFATFNGENISVQPDVAFTASSIIKIPIMISAFRRMGDNSDIETLDLVAKMIDLSGNEAADWLMERVIDPVRGPLVVSEDMEAIGLRNTFLAGKFTLGSPLLRSFTTPANSRADINTDPDPYSQTTTSDIGMLLADLYHCSQSGGGTLPAVFPGEIGEAKCQTMVNYLINNKLPSLLTAGIPEGTQIAHKHGWVTTNGVIRTMGDAGIIYSPGGTYVLVIFFYNSDQLIWDPASILMAELSKAVYNYYNLPQG